VGRKIRVGQPKTQPSSNNPINVPEIMVAHKKGTTKINDFMMKLKRRIDLSRERGEPVIREMRLCNSFWKGYFQGRIDRTYHLNQRIFKVRDITEELRVATVEWVVWGPFIVFGHQGIELMRPLLSTRASIEYVQDLQGRKQSVQRDIEIGAG
jgi:hypothetical protein